MNSAIEGAALGPANNGPAVRELGSKSLNTTVYEAIKQRILTNNLRPGNKLTHQLLAEILQVSRTPVREALERLYQEGFVIHVPRRGFFVAEIGKQEAHELYQMREALEIFAIRQSLTIIPNPIDLKTLEDLNERYGALVLEDRTRERMLVDRDFHLALASASGNGFLIRTLSAVFERLILKLRVDGFWTTRGAEAYREHAALIQALRLADADSACEIMSHHIREARRRVFEQVDAAEAEGREL